MQAKHLSNKCPTGNLKRHTRLLPKKDFWETEAPGGYSIYPWVGMCDSAPHTLTLFKTKIADFPTLFKTEFRFLIPSLRHSWNISAGCLSSKNRVMGSCLRKDTLFMTKIDKINTLFKTKILQNIPWLAARPH